ncbi:sugar ABC transporter substrate-binding protein [Burkholderia anthina]|uniref:LacI family transcriptional regulator n=1 Tax=Burkholderia anthina TaxID=179879 RepID=A0A6P2GA94_9BURK|nr:sugar ABC transporter substrate-binding protein [Burkholderia anthina]MBM2766282.1 sugar ABC transporter substrate-binding protein [Burkholderia anthina]VVU50477.1 LacI family transcriptional regulator [Burkholderia anthina]
MKNNFRLLSASVALGLVLAAGQAAHAKEQIYSLMPNTALSGVTDPYMADRTSIRKAWPKKPADPAHLKVGWTEITLGNPWFVELAKGVRQTSAKYGFVTDMQVADGDLQRQCSQIDNFVTRKMDVIVVDPTDTIGVAKCINRAVDAGIPVVTIGTVPDPSARILTTISPNPYENGFGAGEYIAKSAGANTPITAALIIGVLGNSTSESRLNGMVSGIVYERMKALGLSTKKADGMLRGYKLFEQAKKTGHFDDPQLKFKVVALAEGKWTEEGGLAAAEDILTAHGTTLNYIIADNDSMAMGAMRAVRGIGKQGEIKVAASADGLRVALEQIKKGNLLVTGMFSGEATGVGAIEFLHKIFYEGLDANNLPMGSYFPAGTITRENVDQMIDPNKDNKFYKYTIPPVKTIPQIKAEATAG